MKTVFLSKLPKNLLIAFAFVLAALLPAASKAASANILFYYSSCDAFSSTLLKPVTVLRNAGNTVTLVDVACGTGFCPTEIWTNFDQVWDCRYANINGGCPGTTQTDNFTACWQTKAQDYIENHCGNMFILGENAGFGSRDDGDYTFLKTIGAVGAGLVNCPTGSANANDSTAGSITIPSSLPGTTQYFGDFVGGIPTSLLNGTSFADEATGWNGTSVDRSVASGWSGSAQMTNLTGCNVGKLFIDWDMSKWLFSDYDSSPADKAITDTFYAAIGNWLGVPACTCNTPTPTPTNTPTNTPTVTPVITPTSTLPPCASIYDLTWSNKASMPTARDRFDSGVINNILYAVGGETNGGHNAITTVEAYDPSSDSWSTKAPMPTARQDLAVGVINGILYAVGGRSAVGTILNTLEAYDPSTNTWTTLASMPTARENLTVNVVNGILYAVGGDTGAANLGTVEAYDPSTNTWTTKTSMPTPRNSLASGVINGILYTVSGKTGIGYVFSGIIGTVEAYDPSTDTWSTKASVPTPRYCLSAQVINGILYAIGGADVGGFTGLVEVYDPVSNSWGTKTPMPTTTAAFGTGFINGVLYGVGGYNNSFLNVNQAGTLNCAITSPTNTPTNSPTKTPTNSPTLTPTNSPTPTPTPVVGVSIQETVSSSTAQPGDTLTYTITLNVTGGPAANVVVTDSLASSVTFIGFGSSPGGTAANYNSGTSQSTWTLPTSLAPGTYTISYQVKVNGNFASGTITNTASMTYTGSASPVTASVDVKVTSELHVWPNPFNPNFAVPNGNGVGVLKASVVPTGSTMSYYSISGELVIALSETSPGEIDWDGKNVKGSKVSTGTYYYVIQNGNTTLLTGKILLLNSK